MEVNRLRRLKEAAQPDGDDSENCRHKNLLFGKLAPSKRFVTENYPRKVAAMKSAPRKIINPEKLTPRISVCMQEQV